MSLELIENTSVTKAKSSTHVAGVKCGGDCDYCEDAWQPALGATSLDGLVAAREAQEQTYALQGLAGDFSGVISNIVASPLIEDKGAAIAEQAGLFQQMVSAISAGAKSIGAAISKAGARHNKSDNEAVQSVHDMAVQLGALCAGKAKSAFGVCKGLDGNYYGLGVFTNCYQDLDGEIITSAAHKEFSAYLDANPAQAPELWTWHEPGTARKSRANWWDFDSEGFFWMQWPLTADEAKALASVDGLTMSHQFNGIKQGNEWVFYRTFEASVLAPGAEANPLTSFESVQKELTMAFDPIKRDMFVKMHGEAFTVEREQLSGKARASADAAGTARKEAGETATNATATTPTVDTAAPTLPDVHATLATLTNSLTQLTADVTALSSEVKALKAAKANEIEQAATIKAQQQLAWLTSPRTPTVGIADAAKAQGETLTPEQMRAAGVVDSAVVAPGWENAGTAIRRNGHA